jgi:hypothetical protein
MASENPPSGWEVTSGTWGTDIVRDESTTLTGQAVIKFPSGGGGGTITSPWIPTGGDDTAPLVPVELIGYSTFVRLYSGTASGGADTVTVKIYYYDEDRGPISNSTVLNAALPSTGQWLVYGETVRYTAGARWMRVEVTKADTAFDLYLDSVVVQKNPPVATEEGDASVTIGTGSFTSISVLDLAAPLWRSETAMTNAEAGIKIPGTYLVTASATWIDLQDGEEAGIRVKWTGATGSTRTSQLNWNQASASNGNLTTNITWIIDCDQNSTVYAEVYQATGGDRHIEAKQLGVVRISN